MTDTILLDKFLATLERNPLSDDRMRYPLAPLGSATSQFRETDAKPFYSGEGPHSGMNSRYADRVDLFHQVNGSRLERPRRGTCNQVRVIERHIDGEVYTRRAVCGGLVHAVETRIAGAVRIDGKCLNCGWKLHRAGLLEAG